VNRRIVWAVLVLLAAGGVTFALTRGEADPPEPAPANDEPRPPSVEDLPGGRVAPLTGVEVPDDQLALLARPALAVKVDNHPAAVPEWGLGDADIVVELRVEGISRFLAVFHSRDVGDVGPVRSARTSDPELLAMFGRPLAAWSGANPATTELMRATPWIQDVSAYRLPDAYRRDRGRRAPHNLVLDARRAFAAAEQPPSLPEPLFRYRSDGQPPGVPVAGVRVAVGTSVAQWVWDDDRGGWLRWSDGRPLGDADPARPRVAPANVVILETTYQPSPADERSPEAVTTGSGRAWILTGGHFVEGRWERPSGEVAWSLTAADGTGIELGPGATWVALPAMGSDPVPLSAEAVAALVRP
jgi:hypothetical protein